METMMLRTYTIFDHPKDHPDCYVVRAFDIIPGEIQPVPMSGHLEFRDLLSARLWMVINEPEKVCITRSPDDDPVIVETWV